MQSVLFSSKKSTYFLISSFIASCNQTNTSRVMAIINTNNKYHFLTYMLTRLSISTFQPLNLCMFTEEDSATINEDKKF